VSGQAGRVAGVRRLVLLLAAALVVGLGAILLLMGVAAGLPVVVGATMTP
jgi:hypothetical protein